MGGVFCLSVTKTAAFRGFLLQFCWALELMGLRAYRVGVLV